MNRSQALRITAVCVLAGCAVGAVRPVDDTALSLPESFTDPASLETWTFSNGPEWPGARGRLERRETGGRTNDGVLVLHYDFTDGGHYVAALAKLPPEPPVKAVRFWVHKPAANLMIVRAVDAEGETFQKDLRFDYRAWQQVEIALADWIHSWSGDGTFQWPARQFDILIENDGGNRRGELLIDDVQWVYRPEADDSHMRPATYTEATFADAEGWRCDGPAGTALHGRRWSCRFSENADRCYLRWGKSVLGKPRAMRLTVISDGCGHELRAEFGSHFQQFERSLGTLAEPGRQTLEVPLGDMTTWRHFGGEDDGIVRFPLRLENLSLVKQGESTEAEIGMVSLEFDTEHDRSRPVVLIPSVKAEDDRAVFTARLRSLHDAPLAGQVRYTIQSTDRVIRRGASDLTVPPGGQVTWSHKTDFGDQSLLEGTLEFTAGAYTSGPLSTTIARAPDPPAGGYELDPSSRMGVGMYLYRFHQHPEALAWMERMCRLAAAAGVKWTREEFHWNWIERSKGEFDFSFFDQLVDTADAHGISVYGLVAYWTEWNQPPFTDEFIEHYCDYLRVLVGRYKDRIKHWEIWNEPNIFFWPGKKERYPALLKRAYETIKSVDPEAEVLGCSTAGIDVGFIKLTLDHDGPFDALTVHPYRHALDPHGLIRELRETRALVGGRDVWITEMGWPSHIGGLTERQQAGYVARTYIAALASGAVRSVSWYDFREDGTDPFYNEHHFGLVRNDLTPKIGYRALAAVGRLLGAAHHVRDLALGDGLTGFLFRADGRRVATLWAVRDTRIVQLKLTPVVAEVLNTIAEPAACLRDGHQVLLRLDHNLPIYITADEPIEIDVLPPPIEISAERPAVHPGEAFTLQWRHAPGVRVAPPILPAGWTIAVSKTAQDASIVPSADAAPGTYTVRVPVQCGDVALEVPVVIKVLPALLRG